MTITAPSSDNLKTIEMWIFFPDFDKSTIPVETTGVTVSLLSYGVFEYALWVTAPGIFALDMMLSKEGQFRVMNVLTLSGRMFGVTI